ncbi:hypothetical protein [Roseovarius sp. Pro17]|uniref:hypothetical protein n=1 Tax=Roseovarius sp. Pro17 TaxID=3108175 RepID=UPI002D76792E|nr:hypothetical protein [Roseovarius sp. Pro17]
MIDANDAITKLYNQLCETQDQYATLFAKVKDTEFGDVISTILSRRKDNIAELRVYLCIKRTDVTDAPRSDAVAVSSPLELVANERRILAAYDKAIAPISGRHEKFDFLVAQHKWLQSFVANLSDALSINA